MGALQADSGDVVSDEIVPGINVSFGGGNFCIEQSGFTVYIAYVTLAGDSVAILQGTIEEGGGIKWDESPVVAVVGTIRGLSAPWVCVGTDNRLWISVVGKEKNFYVSMSVRGDYRGAWRQHNLLALGEEWIHSAIQLLPINDGQVLAVGFSGDYPRQTQMVYKLYNSDNGIFELKHGKIALCNVNDKTTFHFQAVSDPISGNAYIVYLDRNLSISYAVFKGEGWSIHRSIVIEPSYSPQLTLDNQGNLHLLYVDYNNMVKLVSKQKNAEDWVFQGVISEAAIVNISPTYSQTYYGTGGLISVAKSVDFSIPYLSSYVDDTTGTSTLWYSCIGRQAHLVFPKGVSVPVCLTSSEGGFWIKWQLSGLKREMLLNKTEAGWLTFIRISEDELRPLAIRLLAIDEHNANTMEVQICQYNEGMWSTIRKEIVNIGKNVNFKFKSIGKYFALVITESDFIGDGNGMIGCHIPNSVFRLNTCAVVDLYGETRIGCKQRIESGQVVDCWPFKESPNAKCAKDSTVIPHVFKRIL